MDVSLLEVLACPKCHAGLVGPETGVEVLADGPLVCANGHAYVVQAGIPRLLVGDPAQEGTADSFGAKWEEVRVEDMPVLTDFQFAWYDERYGWGDEAGLATHLAGCDSILDAGCGLGYDAARYARLAPHADVYAFDLSASPVEARRKFGDAPNIHFAQGDILAPPYAARSFDFVVSDQVIHHTPDCRLAFEELAELVRPGGQIAVYVYKKKGLLRELADDHIREVTTQMSVEECIEFSEQVTELGRELSHLDARITLERGIPLLGIEPGEHDVQRLIYWSFLKCFWNDDLGQHQSVMGNLDWYHPPYASRHTPEEVTGWCADLGLEVVHLGVVESGISLRARRPADD